MNKLFSVIAAVLVFGGASSFAQDSIRELNQMNYISELATTQVAVVVYASKNVTDDYNTRLREHELDLMRFFEQNPFIKFYSVDSLVEVNLTRIMEVGNTPAMVIYKFGQPVSAMQCSRLVNLDELIQMVNDQL